MSSIITLFALALLLSVFPAAVAAADAVDAPAQWGEAEGNPYRVDGEPRWRADRVWPDDPAKFDAYQPLTWVDGSWRAQDEEKQDAPPRVEVKEGVVLLAAKAGGRNKNRWMEIPAIVYVVPEAGWYGLTAEAATRQLDGYGEIILQLVRRGNGRADRIRLWSLEDGKKQTLEDVAVQVEKGDELVLMVLANRAAVEVELSGLAYGPELADERVKASRAALAALPRVAVNGSPSEEELHAANAQVLREGADGVVFPADSNVANVKAYGAVGDGTHDDTAAIQAALDTEPRNRLIYVPDGTYLITDTLRWGEQQTRQNLQGQSRDGTILKLMDTCPGFTDPDNPKAMIWTGHAPAQRFANRLFNLTIDSGKGNTGAIGIQYIANNTGAIKDVLIRSGDPEHVGVIGLDMGFSDEIGPCLIKRVTVEGFDKGIYTKHAVDSITFEDVTLRDQREVGLLNDGQCLAIRGLKSTNAVTALHNREGASLTALIDSTLTGTGEASSVPAIINNRGLFARNIQTTGYARAIENTDGTKQGVDGADVDEFVSHEVLTLFPGTPPRSLALPIKETPLVDHGDVNEWVNVKDYEPQQIEVPRPDGKKVKGLDWSPALQAAIDSGARTIYFPHRTQGDYALLSDVTVRGNVERIIFLDSETRGVFGGVLSGHPVTITTRNDDKPLVIERWDPKYTGLRFRHEGKAPLVLQHIGMNAMNGFVKSQGSGDLFLEDVAFGGGLFIEGGNVWARQFNTEGEAYKVKTDNTGGKFWVLGLKTEGDSVLVNTHDGGQSEIVGGFIYANKNHDPDKVMFKIDGTSAMSFTIGEWVIRKQPFNPVQQTRGEEIRVLKRGEAYPRGEGAMIPLYVGTPGK